MSYHYLLICPHELPFPYRRPLEDPLPLVKDNRTVNYVVHNTIPPVNETIHDIIHIDYHI